LTDDSIPAANPDDLKTLWKLQKDLEARYGRKGVIMDRDADLPNASRICHHFPTAGCFVAYKFLNQIDGPGSLMRAFRADSRKGISVSRAPQFFK
jgi:hypothetical protein